LERLGKNSSSASSENSQSKEKIDVLLIGLSRRNDKPKQRDSGLNHVLAKLAKKNDVIIGINLDEILESNPNQKAKIFSRIRQNIKICNKNKLKMDFVASKKENERNLYDLKSLGIVLGMPTWMTAQLGKTF
jgi:ribonuclease P/MRP protein subunit RPP1